MSISIISDCDLDGRGRTAFAVLQWCAETRMGCRRTSGLGHVGGQAELERNDSSPVTFAASVLRFVLAGSKPSLDVDLAAFAQEPVACIRQSSERNDPMPFRALLERAAGRATTKRPEGLARRACMVSPAHDSNSRDLLSHGERETEHLFPSALYLC
jgi:hypothetical protein